MGRVKSALEIALEKADKVGVLSPEEKERMQDEGKIAEILKDFFQGRIDSNSLWQKLRGSKPSVLRMAQTTLIDSHEHKQPSGANGVQAERDPCY